MTDTSPDEREGIDQQLVARIKRSSKYWGQTAPNQWFDVRVVADTFYHLRGNNNNYRLSDVALGVRLPCGAMVDLSNGRTVAEGCVMVLMVKNVIAVAPALAEGKETP